MLIPTLLAGALMTYSYFVASGEGHFRVYLRSRSVSWWVMTWFISVAIVLTVVGTFFRGPGWSWIWPWRGHAG